MYRYVVMGTQHAGRDHPGVDYLRQEIAFLETRLNQLGGRGDGRYEQSLSRAYRMLLRERRQQLDRL
ncbi:MAG TPA: hypothetical protein VES89_13165 [Candidatus Competibacteraceae bacterium]|nr:hypothetical protein [Candidatus Competibacteraceae bacterium]